MKLILRMVALLGMACAGPVSAQSINPGLWEVVADGAVDNPAMLEAIRKLSPEARKKMKLQHRFQICITPEQAADLTVIQKKGCTLTWLDRTSKPMTFALDCTRKGQTMHGDGWLEIISPEAWKANIKTKYDLGGNAVGVESDSSGKWMGSDCGTVKPRLKP
ncbi:MAG: DUF3617 domain-containing protein [Azovibrio sp.]